MVTPDGMEIGAVVTPAALLSGIARLMLPELKVVLPPVTAFAVNC